jgi:predicted RNA binding protein YcfA (HicA-like mRNA interferase family)
MLPFPPIKTKTFIKILEALGFEFNRSTGSHFFYTRLEDKRPIIVKPKDKDIPPFHVKTYIKQIGVDQETFFAMLEDLK